MNHSLVIWNSEKATRAGPGASNHSIIDLKLSLPNIELNWSIAKEENLYRLSGDTHESHPIGLGRKEDSRGAVHGC